MNMDQMRQELKRDEGVRGTLYYDSLGIPSAGVGRNMRDVGLSPGEIDMLLGNDIARVLTELRQALPWFVNLNDAHQRVLVNMGFMGVPKLLQFHKMLAALQAGDRETAAAELMDSTYSKQVGQRANRLAEMIRNAA